MATILWVGRAQAVAQLTTITVGGTVLVGEAFSVTINGKTISFTSTSATVANVTAGLAAALSASGVPAEFSEITWGSTSTTVTATGKVAGVPHAITVAEASASGTISASITTAATGPNDAGAAANYSGGSLPTDGDTLIFQNSNVPVRYHLDALAAVQLAKIIKYATYTAEVKLPATNAAGGYPEYRPTFLRVGCDELIYGIGDGNESGGFNLDYGSDPCDVQIYRTGTSSEQGIPAVMLRDSQASPGGTIEIIAGSLGIATLGGDAAQIETLNIGEQAAVTTGLGAIITNVASLGNSTLFGEIDNIEVRGGNCTVNVSAAPSLLDVTGGNCFYNSDQTVAVAKVGPGAINTSRDLSDKTFTAFTLRRDGTVVDPNNTITYTAITIDPSVRQFAAA